MVWLSEHKCCPMWGYEYNPLSLYVKSKKMTAMAANGAQLDCGHSTNTEAKVRGQGHITLPSWREMQALTCPTAVRGLGKEHPEEVFVCGGAHLLRLVSRTPGLCLYHPLWPLEGAPPEPLGSCHKAQGASAHPGSTAHSSCG